MKEGITSGGRREVLKERCQIGEDGGKLERGALGPTVQIVVVGFRVVLGIRI